MADISAVILTKNEENHIVDCIESLRWCNEILVIDDNSTDRTLDILQKLPVKVYQHPLQGDFAAQRNFALEKASGDWVLFLDADEKLSLSLQYEILSYLNNPFNKNVGYFLKRKDYMWGKELKYGENGSIQLLRLARKHAGKWEGKVHEVWKVKGTTATLTNPLAHYPHPTVQEYLEEINHYTDLRAEELFKKRTKVQWWDIILYPCAKFSVDFFVKRGFLDGMEGLVCAFIMSFHSFLVRGKLWQLNNSTR